jgi:hypothetical protein
LTALILACLHQKKWSMKSLVTDTSLLPSFRMKRLFRSRVILHPIDRHPLQNSGRDVHVHALPAAA